MGAPVYRMRKWASNVVLSLSLIFFIPLTKLYSALGEDLMTFLLGDRLFYKVLFNLLEDLLIFLAEADLEFFIFELDLAMELNIDGRYYEMIRL